jgi:selenocysteine-specific elongation factor
MRPEAIGIRLNELYESFEAGISRPLLEATLRSSMLDHEIEQTGPYYHSPDFKPRLPDSESATWQTISATITDNGPRPPTVQEIAEIIGMDTPRIVAALERATRMKLAVQIEPRRFFLRDSINALKALITEMALTATDGLVTTAAYRDASGLGRNLTIAVLEYFDATKFTRRIGNARRVMKSPD